MVFGAGRSLMTLKGDCLCWFPKNWGFFYRRCLVAMLTLPVLGQADNAGGNNGNGNGNGNNGGGGGGGGGGGFGGRRDPRSLCRA